jgi:hypothetical protein
MEQFEHYLREQFEDFESDTAPESWEKIREQLHPKKRRIVAFWWLPTGIAAMLLLYLGLSKTTTPSNDNAGGVAPASPSKIIVPNSKNSQQTITILDKIPTSEPSGKKENTSSTINSINKKVQNTASQKAIPRTDITIKETIISSNNSNVEPTTTATTNNTIENIISIKRENTSLLAALQTLSPAIVNLETNTDLAIARIEDKKPSVIEPLHRQKQHFKFYATIGLSSNYRNITPLTGDENSLTNIKTADVIAINRMGWQANIGVQIPLFKHFVLRPSLNYQGYVTQLQYDLAQPKIENLRGITSSSGNTFTINEYPTATTTEQQIYHSINAQADIMYFFNKKNALSVGAGVGRFLGNSAAKQTLYSSASFKHQFTRFSVEPFFQYHLRNYRATSQYYDFQPYTIGINFGI